MRYKNTDRAELNGKSYRPQFDGGRPVVKALEKDDVYMHPTSGLTMVDALPTPGSQADQVRRDPQNHQHVWEEAPASSAKAKRETAATAV